MKYRIIMEANGNGEYFYEVHFYKPVRSIFGFRRWRWEAEFEWQRQGMDYHFKRTKRFTTLAEATQCVNANNVKRSVYQEGEVENERWS